MSKDKPAWKVTFTSHAESDILGILTFTVAREGPDMAEAILKKFINARDSLLEFPDTGRIPPELMKVNTLSFKEIQATPYRLVYKINKTTHEVHIHIVADGRRNFTEILKERLLNPTVMQTRKRIQCDSKQD